MSPYAQRLLEVLTPELGPHTAGQALQVACRRAMCDPERLGPDQLDTVLEQVERMCRTLLGRRRSAVLVQRIRSGTDGNKGRA